MKNFKILAFLVKFRIHDEISSLSGSMNEQCVLMQLVLHRWDILKLTLF